jgi:diguanylate cyclase (GGDEF)-like protein
MLMENFECFDEIRFGLILIDSGCEIIKINSAARDLLGCTSELGISGNTCHHLLFQSSSPCPDCPRLNNFGQVPPEKSFKIKREGNDIFLKVRYSFNGEKILLTLYDMTREISSLRDSDLTRRELNAKNIILKQKHRESEKQLGYFQNIFNLLPDLLVDIDSSFQITKCNSAVLEVLKNEKPEMCYEIMGHSCVCEQCPVETGELEHAAGIKKSHRIDDRFYTEEFSMFSPGKGGLLVFRDTTRQIQLIEQIREQSETLTKKNKLLSGLADLEIKMHKEDDPKVVLEYFLDIFLPLYQSDAAAVIISDIRLASIWFTLQRGLSDEEMNALSRSFVSREVQTVGLREIPGANLPWEDAFQFNLMGAHDRLVGIIIMKGFGSADSQEITKLFKEPLGAFIQNRLLMRQLEEKANTDPLTGLYNRGYIDQAIAEEEIKFLSYNIPFSIVMVDVNGLKKANDVHGHAIGDQLILTVSKKLMSSIRVSDVVARTGGDEFIILLTGTADAGAQKFIERLQNIYFKDLFIDIGNQDKLQVSASLGAAGADRFPPQNLILEADRLMYEAKNAYYSKNARYR